MERSHGADGCVAVRCRGAEVDNDPKTLVTEECRKTVCAEAWANYLEVSAALLRRVPRQLFWDRNPGRLAAAHKANGRGPVDSAQSAARGANLRGRCQGVGRPGAYS